MIETTANFDTYNALKHKKPVWIIEFDGITTKFCSQTFNDIDSNYKKYIRDFLLEPIQIDVESLNHVFGGYRFSLIDKDQEVTQMIIDEDIFDTRIDVKYGFQEIDRADFIELPPAYITNWQIGNDLLSFDFTSRVLSRELNSPPCAALSETNLYGYMTPTAPDPMSVDDGSLWPSSDGVIQIGDEFIAYTLNYFDLGKWRLSGLTRGYRGSKAAYHATGDIVTCIVEVSSLAGSFIGRILTTTNAGTNGILDLGIYGFGAGVDQSLLDINGILNEDAKYNWISGQTTQTFRQIFNKEDESIHNTIEEILQGTPAILRFKNNKLSVQYYEYDVYDYYVDEITDDDMKINSYQQGDIINILRSQTYKEKQGSFHNDQRVRLVESVTKYNDSKLLNITCPQAIGQRIGTAFVNGSMAGQAVVYRFLMRFAQENFVLDIDTLYNKIPWEVGDIIRVNSNKLPDFENGGLGIVDKNFQIFEKSANLDGTLNYKLFGSREMMDRLSIATINRVSYENIDHPADGEMHYDPDCVENNYQSLKDAKYDNPASYQATLVRFDFGISIYGYGAPGEENEAIMFALRLQKPIDTDVILNYKIFYYDNTVAGKYYPSYYLYNYNTLNGVLSAETFNRIRADWYYIPGGAGDFQYIKLMRIVFIKLNTTLSISN